MFEAAEKMLETLITKIPTTQKDISRVELTKKKQICKPKKLQRSPKIIGYYREENEFSEISAESKQQILPYTAEVEISCNNNNSQSESHFRTVWEDRERNCSDNNTSNEQKSKVNSVRVKVLLTKKEVAELLAKCKEKKLELTYVVDTLMGLPTQRVDVVSKSTVTQNMVLSTIIEGDEDEDEDEEEEFHTRW